MGNEMGCRRRLTAGEDPLVSAEEEGEVSPIDFEVSAEEKGKVGPIDFEVVGKEAISIFKILDINGDEAISKEEWEKAFDVLDKDGDGKISREEWHVKQGTTAMFDAFEKKDLASITRLEWNEAFAFLDTDGNGEISVQEWIARRQVRLASSSLGSWGVGVGTDFYEVLVVDRTATEMAVVSPRGILALGAFAKEERGRERWLEAMKAEVDAGRSNLTWLAERGEPRARPDSLWQSLEPAGWTTKTEEDIAEFVLRWVEEHPTLTVMGATGGACHDQNFALEFICFLTGTSYKRNTDNAKGRALSFGLCAVAAGVAVGVAAAAYSASGTKKSSEDGGTAIVSPALETS